MKKSKPLAFATLEDNLVFIADLETTYKSLQESIQEQKHLLAQTFCPHQKGDKLLVALSGGHTITVKVDEIVYSKGKIDGFYTLWAKPVGKRVDIFKDIEAVYISDKDEIIENLTRQTK